MAQSADWAASKADEWDLPAYFRADWRRWPLVVMLAVQHASPSPSSFPWLPTLDFFHVIAVDHQTRTTHSPPLTRFHRSPPHHNGLCC